MRMRTCVHGYVTVLHVADQRQPAQIPFPHVMLTTRRRARIDIFFSVFFLLFHFPFYRPNRYADVWNGKADAEAHEAAAFLNSTENSPAHGVHVASYIIAAMGHGSLIDMMNYHSFIEGFELHITSHHPPYTNPTSNQITRILHQFISSYKLV